jgi:hypothetical protein
VPERCYRRRAVALPDGRRFVVGFALGNLVPALVFGLAGAALPVRYLLADALLSLVIATVVGSSGVALFRAERALLALRVGALTLLGFGLLLVLLAALSAAYLRGVQGDYGRGGVLVMSIVLLLALPYLVVYPALELLLVHRRLEAGRATAGASSGGAVG